LTVSRRLPTARANTCIDIMKQEQIVTVFGSSRPRENDSEYEEARELGRTLAAHGFSVCSGAYGGVMAAVSRGAKEAGAKTYGVTAEFFNVRANAWIDVEVRVATWQERLFELIRIGDAFVTCKGGTGTLVELAVVWEMLNKSVITGKPLVALGSFWSPIVECVRQVELAHHSPWGEANGRLIHTAATPKDAALHLREILK
jgi:uncharacterized protein (TIGR00730 family)